MTVQYEVYKDVAVIGLDNQIANGLNLSARVDLMQAMKRAGTDGAVVAIVLRVAGNVPISGVDINEYGAKSALQEPSLLTLIALLESDTKPVVAALQGDVLGAWLELVLGCHFRIAEPECNVALPAVKLGMIPGAGGTQRLPRVLGVEPALDMIISGESVKSEILAKIPNQRLFEKLASSRESLLDEAIFMAREMASRLASGMPLPQVRALPCEHPNRQVYFQSVRNTVEGMEKKAPATLKAIDAVEAAVTMSFADGIDMEFRIFRELLDAPESISLRHLFVAERAAAQIPDVPANTPVRHIRSVAVIGAGTMGSGISMNFLNAGIPVTILDATWEALERGIATIRKIYEAQAKKGKLTSVELEKRMGLLRSALSYVDIEQADLVIESVFEDIAVKENVFRQLDATVKPGAILASNTSTLDLNRIAAITSRPQDVVGMHFFSPANVMRLLELVRGDRTDKDVLATVMDVGRKIGKTCVVSGASDGFIGNRMLDAYLRQAGFLLDEGCSPQQVDNAIEKFGFAMGPFRMSDMAGNDIGWYIRKRRYIERPEVKYSRSADLLCEIGRFGQKAGAGWYDYVPGQREVRPSAAVADLLETNRKVMGITANKVSDDVIVQRLVYALVNEGARILEEGIATKAGDIDIVYVAGYGFPKWHGGPMHYAGKVGLPKVRDAMQQFADNPLGDKAFWQPAALIETLADEGREFSA